MFILIVVGSEGSSYEIDFFPRRSLEFVIDVLNCIGVFASYSRITSIHPDSYERIGHSVGARHDPWATLVLAG